MADGGSWRKPSGGLTENAERNEMREHVLGALRNTTHRIMNELGRNRGESMQSEKELVPLGQTLHGLNGNAKGAVRKI